VTTLFTAVLQAIETRTRTELETRLPGRFRDKGTQPRQWELPFGRVVFALGKLWDRGGRRTVYPLKEAWRCRRASGGVRRPWCLGTGWQ